MFWKKKKKKKETISILDLLGNPLENGDTVIAHRYELGKAKVVFEEKEVFYVSEENDKKISFTKMVDAITGYQKVNKIFPEESA